MLFFILAKHLCHVVVKSVGRRHPSPTKEMLEPLLRTAVAVGLNLDMSSSKALADSLDRAVVRNFFPFVLYMYKLLVAYIFLLTFAKDWYKLRPLLEGDLRNGKNVWRE